MELSKYLNMNKYTINLKKVSNYFTHQFIALNL